MGSGSPGLPLASGAAALPPRLPWWQRRGGAARCSRSGAACLLLALALTGLALNATLPLWLGAGGVEALARQLVELEARGSPTELRAAFGAALHAAGAAPSAGGAAFSTPADGRCVLAAAGGAGACAGCTHAFMCASWRAEPTRPPASATAGAGAAPVAAASAPGRSCVRCAAGSSPPFGPPRGTQRITAVWHRACCVHAVQCLLKDRAQHRGYA